jgi:superfamily II DNA helicase RecQ
VVTTAPETALDLLGRVFGYDAFRSGQQDIIEHVIAGGDALVLMPTGGGKSLCYQIPALHRPGVGVVISPLIALMQDQVDALRTAGVRAGFLNSTLELHERRAVEDAFVAGELDLLYLAPEALRGQAPSASWTAAASRSSRSTRRTASPSGATTSGRTTWRCRCCTSAGRTSPGSP